MKLTSDAADDALLYLFADVTVALTRNGQEIDDPGYRRQPGSFGNASELAGMRVVSNLGTLRFGPWEEDGAGIVDGWIILDQNGRERASGDWSAVREPRRLDEIIVKPGALVLALRGGS